MIDEERCETVERKLRRDETNIVKNIRKTTLFDNLVSSTVPGKHL